MKKTHLLTSLIITTFLMTGCGQDVQSMEYYKAHLDEAKTAKESCDAKVKNGEIKVDYSNLSDEAKNCMNASGALFRFGGNKPIKGDEKVLKTW